MHHAVAAGIEPENVVGLLRRHGRDTAGVLIFTRDDEVALDTTAYRVLSDADVRDRLREVAAVMGPVGLQSISLAGMIPKIGLTKTCQGAWAETGEGAASTWILKVAHKADTPAADVVDTEVLCLHLAKSLRLTDVDAALLHFGDVRAIAVSRYDRVVEADGSVSRIHQEDLAQAIGLNTADPARKFQRGTLTPSWKHAAAVLRAGDGRLSPLARLVCFTFLVGNTDHHAKNTSFLRHADNTATLAPAYDIAAHLHHPGVHQSALDFAGERNFATLTIEHVQREVESWEVSPSQAFAAVFDVTTKLRAALTSAERSSYPGVSEHAWSVLIQRVETAYARLSVTVDESISTR